MGVHLISGELCSCLHEVLISTLLALLIPSQYLKVSTILTDRCGCINDAIMITTTQKEECIEDGVVTIEQVLTRSRRFERRSGDLHACLCFQ